MNLLLGLWHGLVISGAIFLNIVLYGLIEIGIVLLFSAIAVHANMREGVFHVVMRVLLFVLIPVLVILSLMTIFWGVHIIPIPYYDTMVFLV